MAKTFGVEIITPSKTLYRGQCEMVILPTSKGGEGFMADHSWTCMLLDVGEMWLREAPDKPFRGAFIAGGLVDMKDSMVIFTDAAEWREDIDLAKAEERKADAEAWLRNEAGDEHQENEVARAQVAIARSIARMKAAKGGFYDR